MSSTTVLDPVACPFCGLLCDDLRIAVDQGRLAVTAHGCPISVDAFAALPPQEATPRIAGRSASLEEAAVAAAHLLKGAHQPLFAGLATDLAGMRQVLELADRCGAVLDHMNTAGLLRNVRTLQEAGLMSTTFSEVKNRADLVLIVGGDGVSRYPRFFERVVWNKDALFRPQGVWPEVAYLGDPADPSPAVAPNGRLPWVVACPREKLIEAIGALRCLVAGRALDAREAGGVPLEKLAALAERLRRARYGVAVWSAADLDFPHAELTVQCLCDLIKDLNQETRFCGLPLAGSDADLTANEVHVWQTGVPLRTSLAAGYPEYDPYHYAAARLLERGEADALVWISSLSDRLPPATDVPTVVLGAASLSPQREPEVFIPVGRPGVDHAGHLFRADKVVVVRLAALRSSRLPSVAQAVSAILEAYSA